MRKLMSYLSRFRRDERGVLMAETVIMLPLLIWSYLALYVYWDVYSMANRSQKAAYTISDMISREMNTTSLTTSYITGMRDLMEYLIGTEDTVRIRVSSLTYSSTKKRYEVDWSVSPGSAFPALTTANLTKATTDRVPTLADGDRVMVVETEVDYSPAFSGVGAVLDVGLDEPITVGLTDTVMKQFIVTRPRFVPKICMTGFTCS
jgi:Flp pilus assembly protein TadG